MDFPTFSTFSTFLKESLWGQDFVEKLKKLKKLEKPTFFKPSKPKMLKKLVSTTLSTVSSFLKESLLGQDFFVEKLKKLKKLENQLFSSLPSRNFEQVGFSNFFNFSERKSLGPRLLCGKVEKVEKVGKSTFLSGLPSRKS